MRLICALLLAPVTVAGCGGEQHAAAGEQIDCATTPGEAFGRLCSAERQGGLLTLRHRDGGFRRFHIVADGRGLVAADGAEEAKVVIAGKDRIELSAGDDRYRLPAKIAETVR